MLPVSILVLSLLSIGDALRCYVGEIPWGYNAGVVDTQEFSANGFVVPTLSECPSSTRCCSNMAYLVGQRYSCTDDCPIFHARQEVFRRFPTDGGITFCQKPDGTCKYVPTTNS